MDSHQSSAPPISASRRAQIHQILTEYGNKQATSNNPEQGSAAPGRTYEGVPFSTSGETIDAEDVRSDVQDTMNKLRHLIPDRM
jgi:uncharacterized protein YkwD